MKKLAALAAVAALVTLPAAASAHPRAKVYKASFKLVGADGSYTKDTFGKAQLVDGKRNDQLSVHVRKLGSRARYLFRLQSATTACTAGAPGGTDVPDWTYRRGGILKTNRKGVANSFARSRKFTVDRTVEYYVGIYTIGATGAPDELVACARLTHRHVSKHGKKGSNDKSSSHGHKAPRNSNDTANGNGNSNGNGHQPHGPKHHS
jgi:hypothetical protein